MTSSSPKLRFNKNILSSPKENISLKELQSRLDALATELSKVDQDNFNIKSLEKYSADLVSKKLISNRDPGVQALVACCLSDVLRIYAPDAPYTDSQLSDIFKLFIKQFQKLSDPENAYYTQQVYLLTRSAEVRSIILVTDINNSSQLIESIFELFYDPANVFHKKLEPIISDILIEIVSEWDQITTPVLKLILNKFLTNSSEKSVSTSLPSTNSSPFNFSLNICNANPDRLARYLTKFFSEVLFENNEEGTEISMRSLPKIHKLSIEIWKHVPEILGSVMGLIDNELSADDSKIRVIATETIGKILSANSRINFVQVHKPTWITWMKKTLDVSPTVRSEWVEQTAEILVNRNDLNQEIFHGLSKTLIDTDEKVRLSTIKAIARIPSSVLLSKLTDESLLNAIVQLTREKHIDIREEALKILGDLYNESYDALQSTDSTQLEAFLKSVKGIPNHILSLYYINDKNINYLVDFTLLQKILPPNDDELKRVERLMFIFSNLDARAKASFIAFTKRQQQLANVLRKLIEFSEEYNGGNNTDAEIENKINKTINWLVVTIPDYLTPSESIRRFVNINNRRLYYLLKIIISDDSDYKTLQNSTKEFITRIQDTKIVNSVKSEGAFSMKNLLKTFQLLILRSSQTIFNRSNISPLLKLNQSQEETKKVSQELIDNISTISPSSFQNQITDLVKLIKESDPGTDTTSHANTLKAIFHILRKLKDFMNNSDHKFFDKIIEYGRVGNPSEARYAVKILSLSDKKDVFLTQIIEAVYPLDTDNEYIASHLAVVAQLFLVAPYILEDKIDEMTPILIKDILLTNQITGTDDDPTWVDDASLDDRALSPLLAKIYAIKTFTNTLRANGESENSDDAVAENVLKLLSSLIGNGGEIVSSKSSSYPTPKHYQARLRLEAGLDLLKLARFPKYNKMIKPSLLERLVLLIQDENEQVRMAFISKLTLYLKNQEISLKFLPLVYTIAYEPSQSLKSEVKTWIKSSFERFSNALATSGKNEIQFEKSLTGLIYTIAHHSEFLDYISSVENVEENTLKAYTFSLEYIAFFLDSVAKQQNISLLYYLAARVKQHSDVSAEDEEAASHIYRVAELTQLAIKEWQDRKGWVLSSYPGNIELSSDLFRPMKTIKERQQLVSKSFIGPDVLKKLKVIVKQKIGSVTAAKRPRSQADLSGVPKPKRVRLVSAPTKAKKQYRKRKIDSGDDDDDDSYSGGKMIDENMPLRKSSRLKRVDYTQGNEVVEEEEDENFGIENSEEESDEQ